MVHPARVALLGVIAVIAGVAIAALCYSFPMLAHPGGSLSFRQPMLWVAVLILAALIMIVQWLKWRREPG